MDVAVIGAAGDCGRQIAARLAADRLMMPTDRLQLVGRRGGRSEGILHGLATDLEDANAEFTPDIDVALDPSEVTADIIVVAAAGAFTLDPLNPRPARDLMAEANLKLFREHAEAIAKYGAGHEVVLVVTNPVELGVEVFARALGRHRVLGIGAYSDSLRFRREIARDLGVRRQLVRGFVLGEHGDGMVPAWSTVSVHGMTERELASALPQTARGAAASDWEDDLPREKAAMMALLDQGRVAEAFALVDRQPPHLRVVLKPYATVVCGAKTSLATAETVLDFLRGMFDGRGSMVAAAQALVQGEFHGMHGVLGVPLVVGDTGVQQILEIPLTNMEIGRLARSADTINSKVQGWLDHG